MRELRLDREHTVVVRGVGRVLRRPDQATLTVSVEVTAPTAGGAQGDTSTRMRGVLEALSARRLDPGDLSTQAISLEPTYDYREAGPRLTGYRATQAVLVRLRRIDELGPVIDAVVGVGATGIGSVSMDVADRAGAEAEARALAVTDARARAEVLARAGGVTLGEPLWIAESPPPEIPRPMMRMSAEAMGAADTPVSEGSTELVAEVEVGFAIRH